jgi:hypothetical protein
MDNPIIPVDKSSPYPGTGAVKPLQQSEREKGRSFSETLQETLEEEQERKKKAKQDAVILAKDESEHGEPDGDQWIPSDTPVPGPPVQPGDPEIPPDDGRIDLTA